MKTIAHTVVAVTILAASAALAQTDVVRGNLILLNDNGA